MIWSRLSGSRESCVLEGTFIALFSSASVLVGTGEMFRKFLVL